MSNIITESPPSTLATRIRVFRRLWWELSNQLGAQVHTLTTPEIGVELNTQASGGEFPRLVVDSKQPPGTIWLRVVLPTEKP